MEIRKGKAIWSCTGETGVDLYKIFTRDFEYTPGDEAALRKLGVNLTSEPVFASRNIFME